MIITKIMHKINHKSNYFSKKLPLIYYNYIGYDTFELMI